MNDATNTDPNDYSSVSDETLYTYIRELETYVGVRPLGSREREGGQKLIDKYCAELGRRGLD